MRSLLSFLTIFLLIMGVLVGFGMGVGVLVRWLMPAIDVGVGTLIGVVATGFSLLFFGRLMTLPDPYLEEDMEPHILWRMTPPRMESLASRRKRQRKRP